jgi:hypothetical protein
MGFQNGGEAGYLAIGFADHYHLPSRILLSCNPSDQRGGRLVGFSGLAHGQRQVTVVGHIGIHRRAIACTDNCQGRNGDGLPTSEVVADFFPV